MADLKFKKRVGKCEVVVETVVSVRIKGEPREGCVETELGPLPLCPDDGGLIEAFIDWLHKSTNFRTKLNYRSGGGEYATFFTPSQGRVIERWFEVMRVALLPEVYDCTIDIWSYLQGDKTWDEMQDIIEELHFQIDELIREPFDESRVVEGSTGKMNCYRFKGRRRKG